MRELISYLILPIPVFIILIILATIFYRLRKKKTAKYLLWISGIWFLAITTPFLPNLVVNSLEKKYEIISKRSISEIKEKTNILVLGGGHTDDARLEPYDRLSGAALCRLAEGVRLYNLFPNSTLITSGSIGHEITNHALVMAKTAMFFGVDSANIKSQSNPKNTRQEAKEYKRLFGEQIQLILVTSATHMPRAMYLFKKEGLNPIPAPTNFKNKNKQKLRPFFWKPSSDNIKNLEAAIHEYVGLIHAKIRA